MSVRGEHGAGSLPHTHAHSHTQSHTHTHTHTQLNFNFNNLQSSILICNLIQLIRHLTEMQLLRTDTSERKLSPGQTCETSSDISRIQLVNILPLDLYIPQLVLRNSHLNTAVSDTLCMIKS